MGKKKKASGGKSTKGKKGAKKVEDDATAKKHAAVAKRENIRHNVMEEVLADYYKNPEATKKEVAAVRKYPLFNLRRFIGLAHLTLHEAVITGKRKEVSLTISRYLRKKTPEKINALDDQGRTALSLAIRALRPDMATIMLDCDKADVQIVDEVTGLTALHYAVQMDLAETVQHIAVLGADVDAQDKVGMTPLMLASRMGHSVIADILITDFSAELDITDNGGWTCLFYGVYHNEIEVVKLLIRKGCDPAIKDKKGMLPVDWADHMKFGFLSEYLEKHEDVGLV